jgi:hypothetical protein
MRLHISNVGHIVPVKSRVTRWGRRTAYGDLLTAEINEKQARSIKYQLTIAKLPLAKDLADFQFEGTPINETLVRDLAGGGFLAQALE